MILTLTRPDPGRREEIHKAFINPFEAPQRCVKIKIKLIFLIQLADFVFTQPADFVSEKYLGLTF